MNPIKLMKIKKLWEEFTFNHPKLPMFLKAAQKNAIEEGSIIEIKITTPDGKELTTNVKLNNSDMELIKELSQD